MYVVFSRLLASSAGLLVLFLLAGSTRIVKRGGDDDPATGTRRKGTRQIKTSLSQFKRSRGSFGGSIMHDIAITHQA